MTSLLLVPLGLQALAMFFDEMVFHRRRGLPRWERIGHPLDTLSVALCYAWGVWRAPTPAALYVFIGLGAVSCLLVTKDEGVHSRLCSAGENWLHAVLFVLHPVVLFCFARLWLDGGHETLLQLQLGLTIAVGLFQLLFWSVLWRRKPFVSVR